MTAPTIDSAEGIETQRGSTRSEAEGQSVTAKPGRHDDSTSTIGADDKGRDA